MFKFLATSIVALVFSVNVYAAFPVEYEDALDITNNPKEFNFVKDNLTMTVELVSSGDKPGFPIKPKPLEPFRLRISFSDNSKVKTVDYVTNMNMNMGKYEYTIKANEHNKFVQELTLPKCGSGRTKWYGKIDVTLTNGKTQTRYVFYDVK